MDIRAVQTTDSSASQWVERFKTYLTVECGLASGTLQAYSRDLSELQDHLHKHGVELTHLDLPQLQLFLRSLKDRGLAIASIARRVACLRMFLRYLFGHGALSNDLASLLESPKKWHNLPHALHQKKVRALLEAVKPPA